MQTQTATTNKLVEIGLSRQENEIEQQRKEVINQSNRILSGSAYRGGIQSGLDLLNRLRSDRYKAKSPETNLDVEQIATHASQAVIVSLLFSGLALLIPIIQIILGGLAVTALGFSFQADSQSSFNFWSSVSGLLGFLSFVLGFVGGGLIAYEWVYLRWANARRFLKQSYDPHYRVKYLSGLTNFFKQRVLEPDPSQNVITFGSYRPFLGSGKQISGWTLSVERKPVNSSPDDTLSIAIPIHEFYEAVDKAIDKLKLPHLQKVSQLFINGSELEVDGEILAKIETRPVTKLPKDKVQSIGQGDLASEQRTYRMYRYIDVTRDMTLSYFLRFYNVGSITFIEGSVYTLTSVDHSKFSLTPVLEDSQVMRVIKTVVLAVVLSFFYLFVLVALWYIGVFLFNLWSWWSHDSRQRRAARWQEEYNYGLARTFRESIAAPFYENYYGVQDLTMYWKAIQEAIFSGFVELLQEKGVDTSKFEEKTMSIINNGVMVSGGKFTANQVTAGSGATSIMGSEKVKANGFQVAAQAIKTTVTGQQNS